MALNWQKHPGAWTAGPYMVTERVDGSGWNATALFKRGDDNTSLVIEMKLPSMAAAMDACEVAHKNITHALREIES